ncbi:MAG: hypothetical protein LVO36_01840 [Nitrosopumilus sp. (ex Thoosa mismalolli)]|nr:hypothetical protein [Nitrosopumilus sp. (ex Thoosa mismalolli)]
MNEQEQLVDNLLNADLEIVEHARSLHEANWDSGSLKQQVLDMAWHRLPSAALFGFLFHSNRNQLSRPLLICLDFWRILG